MQCMSVCTCVYIQYTYLCVSTCMYVCVYLCVFLHVLEHFEIRSALFRHESNTAHCVVTDWSLHCRSNAQETHTHY